MSCPTATELEAFHDGEAGADRSLVIQRHLDACDGCAGVLSTLSPTSSQRSEEPAAGGTVGRFVIERVLGQGGMGVVYAAHDPQLGRKVALKLLRSGIGTVLALARPRMLREAQAMARLTHPNVVVVYDAGTVDDRVFIAMELVEGTTLLGWTREAARGWEETLDLYMAAGRGLAAAHAVGLVHRDFKPANVLVGADLRARVTDFGLARDVADLTPIEGGPEPADSDALTQTGAVLGTPAYMAPEQRRGESTTALSDQFSFCVSLYEGLHGERPYQQPGWRPAPEKRGPVPAAVRRVLARGLALDPHRRWPSMTALLDALASARRRGPRGLALIAGVAVAGAGLTALALRPAAVDPCAGFEGRMAEVWDPTTRKAMQDAFAASTAATAAWQWQHVSDTIDHYAADWVQRRQALCVATERKHEVPPELGAARASCLDQRLENLRTWVGVFTTSDEKLVRRAAESALARDELVMCDESASLLQPAPSDPVLRAEIQSLRGQLGAVYARKEAGAFAGTLESVDHVRDAAKALGYPPLEAEAVYMRGTILQDTQRFDEAAAAFTELGVIAEEARYDSHRLAAWIGLALVRDFQYRYDESETAARYAEAVVKPMSGGRVEWEKVRILLVRGLNASGEGRLDEALALMQRATSEGDALSGPDSPRMGRIRFNMCAVLVALSRFDEAVECYGQVERIFIKSGGREHPLLGRVAGNLGVLWTRRGEHERALAEYRRSLELNLAILPPDRVTFAYTRTNMGESLIQLGRIDEGLAELQTARAMFSRVLDARADPIAEADTWIGIGTIALGKPDAAIEPLERALAVRESTKCPALDLAETRFALARALWDANRDRPRALALAEEARAVPERRAMVEAWQKNHR